MLPRFPHFSETQTAVNDVQQDRSGTIKNFWEHLHAYARVPIAVDGFILCITVISVSIFTVSTSNLRV